MFLPNRLNSGDLTLFVANSATQSAHLDTGTGFTWDTNQWYLVGGSWAQSALSTVYVRALTGPNTNTSYFATSIGSLTAATGPGAANVAVGYTTTFGAPLGGLGDYALFRAYNDYTATQPGFDALYVNLFIPEPSTALLAGAGGFLLWRRLRRE